MKYIRALALAALAALAVARRISRPLTEATLAQKRIAVAAAKSNSRKLLKRISYLLFPIRPCSVFCKPWVETPRGRSLGESPCSSIRTRTATRARRSPSRSSTTILRACSPTPNSLTYPLHYLMMSSELALSNRFALTAAELVTKLNRGRIIGVLLTE